MSVSAAAVILAKEPESPVTKAVKLWGDDEDPFRNLIVSKSAPAEAWRHAIKTILGNLKPDRSGRTVYRGWYFSNAGKRSEFMAAIEREGIFVNERIGMSASRRLEIAAGDPFLNEFGIVWEIRKPRTARNMAPIFSSIGAKFPAQREVIFPMGARFKMVSTAEPLRLNPLGKTRNVPYYVFQEDA
jgi:hypothetical protein